MSYEVRSETLTVTNITTDRSIKVIFAAEKNGIEIINHELVQLEGDDITFAEAKILFRNMSYYGEGNKTLTEEELKSLSNSALTNSKELHLLGLTTSKTKYYHYAYPKTYGKLMFITQNGSLPVLEAFTLKEVKIKNKYNKWVDMYHYTSNQPGAFTNVTLEFK